VVDAALDQTTGQLSGQGSMRLRNIGKHDVHALVIHWFNWRSGW
jgi:hypothetical protein